MQGRRGCTEGLGIYMMTMWVSSGNHSEWLLDTAESDRRMWCNGMNEGVVMGVHEWVREWVRE